MNTRPFTRSLLVGALLSASAASVLLSAGAMAQPSSTAASGSLDASIAAIKKSVVASEKALRTMEWTETTTVVVEEQQKQVQVVRCRFGEDGELVKSPLSVTRSQHGRESDAEESIQSMERQRMAESIADAKRIVERYLPPDPALIDRCNKAGHAKTRVLTPGKRVALDFHNYLAAGDLLSVEIDPSANTVIGMSVVTTMGENPEPITMNVTIGELDGGEMYIKQSELLTPAKGVRVQIQNTDFTPMGSQP